MQSNDNIELSQTSSIRFFPGVSNGNANPPIAMGAMRKKLAIDWIPHLTVMAIFISCLGLIWSNINSQIHNMSTDIRELRSTDIRELRTDIKKLDPRLDSIEKDIVYIKTRLSLVHAVEEKK